MHNDLLDITRTGLRGKKRSSMYLLLVCFFSVAFAVINVSITGSLNRTREELRHTMYGEWDTAVYSPEPLTTALQDERIREYGTALIYGKLLDDGETILTGVGTLDSSLRALGRLEVQSGRFPEKDNEIAIEADVLSDLGYDYELGQTLSLRIMDKDYEEEEEHDEEIIAREFILCGVLREYTGLWNTGTGKIPLAGACVTENAAKEIGSICSYQYFLSAEKGKSHELYRDLKDSYQNTVENTSSGETNAREEYHYFNLALILITTLAAVIVIYSIQIKEQMRSIQLFRTIGATKKQLSVIIFYETMMILLPAAAGGIAAGSLVTWILLQFLMKQSVSTFYISIPSVLIAGILLLWFGAVFSVRFLIFRYSLRGHLSAQKRGLPQTGRKHKSQKQAGVLLLSSASVLAVIFCYLESLSPIYIDDLWAQVNSYTITRSDSTQPNALTDEYIETIKSLPGIDEVVAWSSISGTLEFPDMAENPFASLLTEHLYGPRMWDTVIDGNGEIQTDGPDGLWCFVYGVAEENWDIFFQYAEEEIDREKFRNGESVLLYLPYNTETGIELDGKLYQDFGVAPEDIVTAVNYGFGELSENGSAFFWTEEGNKLYEPYEKLTAVSQAQAEVAGIITADLWADPYLMIQPGNYYAVIASNAFAKKLTETDRDGIQLADGTWSNQEYGYTRAAVYTGMDAAYLSTDYLMAKSAAEHHLEFNNQREEHAAYRQEAIQTLLHIWICGVCIFLILILIQLNTETLYGLTQKRSFALLQIIGMSRRQLRIRLAAKGLFVSLISCLLGHVGYFLYFVIKHIGTYHSWITEFDYSETYAELLKEQLESYLLVGWSLPVHLAFCAFGMACVFLLFFCPQNRVLKENLRESLTM